MAVALLGDVAMISFLARLICGGRQAEIRGGFVGAGKSRQIAECGQQDLGGGEADTGQRHKKLGARVGIGKMGESIGGCQ
jgi:hypothetical protein